MEQESLLRDSTGHEFDLFCHGAGMGQEPPPQCTLHDLRRITDLLTLHDLNHLLISAVRDKESCHVRFAFFSCN